MTDINPMSDDGLERTRKANDAIIESGRATPYEIQTAALTLRIDAEKAARDASGAQAESSPRMDG